MKVLGVDPGSNATGYALVGSEDGGYRLHECGVIRPDGSDRLADRLVDLHGGLLEVLGRLDPDCVAVEGIYHGRNSRTAAVLGHARGVIVMTLAREGLDVAEYAPAEIKKAVVGTGSASKEQVAYMVQQHLNLAEPPTPSDAADGCAAALCHHFLGTHPLAAR